jgi:hypothetical protein
MLSFLEMTPFLESIPLDFELGTFRMSLFELKKFLFELLAILTPTAYAGLKENPSK